MVSNSFYVDRIDTQIENEQRAHHRKNVRQLLYRFNI